MNVIGSRPDGWWRDRSAAMARLAGRLSAWATATGEPMTLVLDGRARPLGEHPGVRVVFAEHADDAIVELAGAEPGAVVAVTSDRELTARLEALGVRCEGARGFRERLDAARG